VLADGYSEVLRRSWGNLRALDYRKNTVAVSAAAAYNLLEVIRLVVMEK
jgi:hypothetical protein